MPMATSTPRCTPVVFPPMATMAMFSCFHVFMKGSTSGGLSVADYFEVNNEAADLGSGGAALPDLSDGPGNIMHLAVPARASQH